MDGTLNKYLKESRKEFFGRSNFLIDIYNYIPHDKDIMCVWEIFFDLGIE